MRRTVLVLHRARSVVLAARSGAGVARIGVLAEIADVARRATGEGGTRTRTWDGRAG